MSQDTAPTVNALDCSDDLNSLDSLVVTVISSEPAARGRAASSCCSSSSCCCCSRVEAD